MVERRKHYDLASTDRQYITAIMRFGIQAGRLATNPALDMQGAIATKKAIKNHDCKSHL
jgi:hypothetical protein